MQPVFPEDPRSQDEKSNWVQRFESANATRAVFGTNRWAKSIALAVDVKYFIDDFRKEDEFCGRPVIRLDDADRDIMTLSTAIGRPLSARERLRSRGVNSLDFYSFLRYTTLNVDRIDYLSDGINWDFSNSVQLRRFRGSLSDDESRETFDRVTSLRRDLDLEAMVVFSDRQADQYFEPFLRLDDDCTFLDVGAFDGYTTVCARKKFGTRLKCHLFEPSPTMFEALKARFADNEGVTLHPIGLADRPQRLCFDYAGSASRIGVGSSSIEVDSLDRLQLAAADLIKVDVEGSEQLFLEGAQDTIKRYQPQLALACYHSNRQFVEVFDRAHELLPDARVYLRHYTEGFAETDVFFVPPRFW